VIALLVTKYVVLMAGHPAGAMTITRTGADRYIHFEFNDRGRGPKVDEAVTLGESGVTAKVAVKGSDYYHGPVDEKWSGGGGFYLPLNGTPEDNAMLARALLRAPDHKLPIVGGGEARIAEAAHTANARMYALSGLGLMPDYVWLDARGELYASGDPSWMFVVRPGAEKEADVLSAQQTRHAAALVAQIAREKAHHPPPAGLAFVHANVLDVAAGKIKRDQTVVVIGDKIVAATRAPAGAEVIDATGKTLLPGLWDMHTHLDERAGLLHIAAGVTTTRDLANDIDKLADLRKRWDSGAAVGPRVIPAGIVDGPGPFAGPTKVLAGTAAEARAAIDRYADLGYAQLKIYSSVNPELVPAMVAHAHERGLRVSGHIPTGMIAEQAVRAGFDEIQHLNFIALDFFPETANQTKGPARFTLVAERARTIDFSSPKVRDFVSLLHDKHIVVDPTINVFEAMFLARKGKVEPGMTRVADRLPPLLRRDLTNGGLPVPEGMDDAYRESFAAMKKLLRTLHDAGVALVPGTDSFAGFGLHRELELWSEAGIPAADILRAATLGAARVMKKDRDFGSIEPGKVADLLLVDGDPLASIGNIRRGVVVVKGGVVYRPAELYPALGIKP
jgi:imidazolonepropionase-like amidohydrolase